MWTPPVFTLPGHQGTFGLRINLVLILMNPNETSIPARSRNPARLPLEPRKSPVSSTLPSAIDTCVLTGGGPAAPGADRTRVHTAGLAPPAYPAGVDPMSVADRSWPILRRLMGF